MAHIAADGSKWTNASAAKRVPGRAQGDGKQPVSKFSKPEPARQPTAEPVSASPAQGHDDSPAPQDSGVQITHDGNMFTVTAKFATQDEAQAAAQSLQGADQDQSAPQSNPAASMM